jgi:hypothetical protein
LYIRGSLTEHVRTLPHTQLEYTKLTHKGTNYPIFDIIIKYIPHNNKALINPPSPPPPPKKKSLPQPIPHPHSNTPDLTQEHQLILIITTGEAAITHKQLIIYVY